jgi:hypothetical protein
VIAMPDEDKEHNRTLKRTVKKIRKSLDDKQFYPRANVMLDRVVLTLVSKSVNVAQGVVSLIDAGLPEEAFGLSRTLVEVALSLRFITNRDSERRANRFAHYSAKWKLELIRRAIKHFKAQDSKGQLQPKYTKSQLRKMTPDYERMVKLARKYPKRFAAGWSGKNVKEMALEADGHDKIDGKPVVWEFDYDWIYAWTSQYVHATAPCMDSHVTEPLEAFVVQIAPERTMGVGTSAVVNTALYLWKILRMAFPALGESFPAELSDPLEKLLLKIYES